MQRLRHIKIVKDAAGLIELQKQNWHFFVEKKLVISSEENFDLNEDTNLNKDLILYGQSEKM